MNTVVETRSLSKWFGEVIALNSLEVSIGSGVTGLLGPNGAGKSTFFKLLLGLYRPSKGTISIFGHRPRNNLDVLRRIGYCPEIDRFYDNVTGFEFLYWLNRHWGMTAKSAKKAAHRSCEIVRMTERMHDPIDEYSKGMRQRIKIAQSLATNADLLLLDEPMAGLDPQGREEMFALIRDLGNQGNCVIVSSHILYEIEEVTDTVILLYKGTVLAQGKVRAIRDLIDEHPHTITVECAKPRELSVHFAEQPATISVDYGDERLTLKTSDPNATFERLNELARENNLDIRSIHCDDDDLQSVFEYLVN